MDKGLKIFISYSIRDGLVDRSLLIKVYDDINRYGNVYIDMIHNDSSNPQKKVIHELNNSDIFLLLLTEGVFKSPWALLEIKIAYERKIPILVIPKKVIYRRYLND